MSQTVQFGKEWQGQTVDGRYPLQQYLGGSDTAAVFLTQLPLDEKSKAAIKLVRATGAEAEALLSNWKHATQLSHPHLLKIFDGGRCWLSGNELLFVVSEFADEDLAQVLPHRGLHPSEVDAMLRPTLSALAYLHDAGMVHSRLHPANIMAVGDQLKLSSDALQPADATPLRPSRSEYEAPEIRNGQISPAADVWSLGVTLVESITQHLPTGKNDSAGIPAPYTEIVRRSLVKDPTKRWTVRDVAAAIGLQLPAPKVAKALEIHAVREETAKIGISEAPKPRIEGAAPPATKRPQAATEKDVLVGTGTSRRTTLIFLLLVAAILVITITVKLLNQGSAPARRQAANTESQPPAEVKSQAAQSRATSEAPATPAKTQATAAKQPPPPLATGATQAAAVLHEVLPNASRGALGTIHGRVKVRIRVTADPSGSVSNTHFVSAGPSHYFSRMSMEAARQWKFTPPAANGQASSSEWNLLFEFSRGGVKAFSERVTSSR